MAENPSWNGVARDRVSGAMLAYADRIGSFHEGPQRTLQEFLVDLRHWARSENVDFESALQAANQAFVDWLRAAEDRAT